MGLARSLSSFYLGSLVRYSSPWATQDLVGARYEAQIADQIWGTRYVGETYGLLLCSSNDSLPRAPSSYLAPGHPRLQPRVMCHNPSNYYETDEHTGHAERPEGRHFAGYHSRGLSTPKHSLRHHVLLGRVTVVPHCHNVSACSEGRRWRSSESARQDVYIGDPFNGIGNLSLIFHHNPSTFTPLTHLSPPFQTTFLHLTSKMFGFTKLASFAAALSVLAATSTYAAPLNEEASTHILEPRLTHYGRATWFHVGGNAGKFYVFLDF